MGGMTQDQGSADVSSDDEEDKDDKDDKDNKDNKDKAGAVHPWENVYFATVSPEGKVSRAFQVKGELRPWEEGSQHRSG